MQYDKGYGVFTCIVLGEKSNEFTNNRFKNLKYVLMIFFYAQKIDFMPVSKFFLIETVEC